MNGVATNYNLNGTQITHLTKGTDWMHFYYGADEKPVLVNFNGTLYTYVYSLQGDVVALLDAGGSVVVEYKYDAWGNIIASTGNLVSTLGYLNPFRYRGYVYDEETGLYYLRSRYYKAAWGRLINKDRSITNGIRSLAANLLFYTLNNYIIEIDQNGMAPEKISTSDKMRIGNKDRFCTYIGSNYLSSNGIRYQLYQPPIGQEIWGTIQNIYSAESSYQGFDFGRALIRLNTAIYSIADLPSLLDSSVRFVGSISEGVYLLKMHVAIMQSNNGGQTIARVWLTMVRNESDPNHVFEYVTHRVETEPLYICGFQDGHYLLRVYGDDNVYQCNDDEVINNMLSQIVVDIP